MNCISVWLWLINLSAARAARPCFGVDYLPACFGSTIDEYGKGSTTAFEFMDALKAFGNFLKVFFGAFLLGSSMGCVTALVSFREYLPFIVTVVRACTGDREELQGYR